MEIAVERELANERVDGCSKRERHRWPALQIPAEKAIGRDADLKGRFRRRRRLTAGPCVFGEREDADETDAYGRPLPLHDGECDRRLR